MSQIILLTYTIKEKEKDHPPKKKKFIRDKQTRRKCRKNSNI